MTNEEWKAFEKTVDEASNLPLYIEDIRYIQDLRSYCRQMKMQNKLDVIFIDYLQLMLTYKKTDNRTGELGDISRNLKALSKEFNIPVIALAQLTRSTERESREPRLSDLRECGDMEQDAYVVMFIHKPADVDDLAEIQDRKIIIAKHRNGAIGYFNQLFEGKTFKFLSSTKPQKSSNKRKEEL
jgi:replicative DNA helicase